MVLSVPFVIFKWCYINAPFCYMCGMVALDWLDAYFVKCRVLGCKRSMR